MTSLETRLDDNLYLTKDEILFHRHFFIRLDASGGLLLCCVYESEKARTRLRKVLSYTYIVLFIPLVSAPGFRSRVQVREGSTGQPRLARVCPREHQREWRAQ